MRRCQLGAKNQRFVFAMSRTQTACLVRDMAVDNESLTQFVNLRTAMRGMLKEEAQNVKDTLSVQVFGCAPRPQESVWFGEGIVITNCLEMGVTSACSTAARH
ncbi:hypothetical protein M378DRAFT_400543 [Amanita muscaria Koide BX008]|uniref:Uncharacterized protein n=1 Tax=Amanita muscaria (strain Koide BX008) TaxID=946122 RepID=A0A0C2ST14_AMAMK|nr:hypothetical protein M378DRAFT_400543 [Amanita muscaria Koide BX008]